MSFAAQAHTNEGVLWWESSTWPGTKRPLGDEPRIAAWLAYNKSPGETFTTEELRVALGERLSQASRNNNEHFQRRIRTLRGRRDGWLIPSSKHSGEISVGSYRLERVGWHPALGQRPKAIGVPSGRVRRLVFERDGSRCWHCGISAGQPRLDRPELNAVLTVGHVHPVALGGTNDIGNLRAECSECNETARDATATPEDLAPVRAAVLSLARDKKLRLLGWLVAGHRVSDEIDLVFDRARRLTPADMDSLRNDLSGIIGATNQP